MEWIIKNSIGEIWSNKFGWIANLSTDEAVDSFSDEEKHSLNLPIGGHWEELKSPLKYIGYSIIFTADVPKERSIKYYRPKGKKWTLTENEWNDDYGEKRKHRKWCAFLSPEEFKKWIETIGLYADKIDTMGSIGGVDPDGNMSIFWQPAISFNEDYEASQHGVYLNAYVTPYPVISETPLFPDEGPILGEDAWEKIKEDVLEKFGG